MTDTPTTDTHRASLRSSLTYHRLSDMLSEALASHPATSKLSTRARSRVVDHVALTMLTSDEYELTIRSAR